LGRQGLHATAGPVVPTTEQTSLRQEESRGPHHIHAKLMTDETCEGLLGWGTIRPGRENLGEHLRMLGGQQTCRVGDRLRW
jgi:hypothetical protein